MSAKICTVVMPALLVMLAVLAPAQAQPWPAKPIRFIVAVTPGAGGDILARAVGEKISHALGQTIVVDNKPGAAGRVDLIFTTCSSAKAFIESGKIRLRNAAKFLGMELPTDAA